MFRRAFFVIVARPSDGSSARASRVYQIRGRATRLLSELAPGSRIDAIGSSRQGFPRACRGETALLAGGGIGLGPLLFIADALSGGNAAKAHRLVLGFRSSGLLALDRPAPRGLSSAPTTAARDSGHPRRLAFAQRPEGGGGRIRQSTAAARRPCSPLSPASQPSVGWPASLSAEQWMACGVGACMGCALPRADGLGYLRACADGPVFEARRRSTGRRGDETRPSREDRRPRARQSGRPRLGHLRLRIGVRGARRCRLGRRPVH